MRALAGVNTFLTCDRKPWHFGIWEGVAKKESLRHLEGLCGADPRDLYAGGKLGVTWPQQPLSGKLFEPFEFSGNDVQFPDLWLACPFLCPRTDLYLASKVDLARRGG